MVHCGRTDTTWVNVNRDRATPERSGVISNLWAKVQCNDLPRPPLRIRLGHHARRRHYMAPSGKLSMNFRERRLKEKLVNLIILVVILLILFGGGGFYYGGPYVGGGLGTVLLIVLIVLLLR
jgi:hypothetical protein